MAIGRAALNRDDLDGAHQSFTEALAIATKAKANKLQLDAHEALAGICRKLGRLEEALDHHDARFALHRTIFNEGADLRVKTLQIAHDTEHARQQAEILRLRTTELETLVRGRTKEYEDYQFLVFERFTALAATESGADGEHAKRVGDLAAGIAHELQENLDWCETLRMAARLHGVDQLLAKFKGGPGNTLLAGSPYPVVQVADTINRSYTARWDGSSPGKPARRDIPLAARIVAVADTFDTLSHAPAGQESWSPAEAVQHIIGERSTQFDPDVVDAFLRVIIRQNPDMSFSATDTRHRVAS